MRILVVEDDQQVAKQVASSLKHAGYVTDVAHDGEEGHFLGDTETYDAVVLDLGLPIMNGLSVLEQWRRDGRQMPVLILSARDTWREKVAGLRAGADDYLAKPFEPEEMLARVETLIRRATGNINPVLECGPITLDKSINRISLNGVPEKLTDFEFRMMSYMMHHQRRVISKTEFIDHIYAQDFDRDSNTIEVLISRLRKKFGSDFIKTYRGQGYCLSDPENAPQDS